MEPRPIVDLTTDEMVAPEVPLQNLDVLGEIKKIDGSVASLVDPGDVKTLQKCIYSTDTAIFNLAGVWNSDKA